ncbi:MAG: VacB/RNase II family 3'-5' exoribonuclease [Bryobacterales bacterium]|nr:VacB/RNase II family 3'-5' exoribonuclease [Bryobacterales bacterium]
MAKRPEISNAVLISHLQKSPHARSTYKQLVREYAAKGDRKERLDQVLNDLVAHGDVIEWKTGHFALASASSEFIAGRLELHRDGYGFVVPDRAVEGLRGDLYLDPEAIGDAMHGDRVLARVARIERDGRAHGEILRILKRAHLTLVGEFRLNCRNEIRRGTQRTNCVIPHDSRIRQRIVIPPGFELPAVDAQTHRLGAPRNSEFSLEQMDGTIVTVEILDFPEHGEPPVGRVIEVLGYPDDFGVDVEIVIRKHHLRHIFPPEVISQASMIPSDIHPSELARREDFRALPIVTIDGETARDFDDAVLVEALDNGNFELQVHIADVSHYVKPGTPIDHEAVLRGTSVYFPDRAVPMLPIELSAGICSLLPNEDRLVLSVILEIDHRGDVVRRRFTEGIIRSRERMTYTNVQKVLDGDPEQCTRYEALAGRFKQMEELAMVLNRKRVRRGSIDFDLPEAQVLFDETGEMSGIERAPRLMAHRIIEEFMLAANEAVAGALEAHGVPTIFRVHERPDPRKVAAFAELAQSFGIKFGEAAIAARTFARYERKRDGRKVRKEVTVYEDGGEITSRAYQKLIAQIEGKPEERVLSYQLLRSLKQARYAAENLGHFALAARSYTHYTSPIRRYPDLVVHRVLRQWLQAGQPTFLGEDGKTPEPNRDRVAELRILAEDCSFTERQAAEAERDLIEWKKVKFMAEKVGEEFAALIVSTTRFGMFVELEDLFVEGLVPIGSLSSDRFHYEETTRRIVGQRTGLVYRVGDRITVRLDRVDELEKSLDFALVLPAGRSSRVGGKKLVAPRGGSQSGASGKSRSKRR